MSERDEGYKPGNFVALGVGVLILCGVLGGAAWLLSKSADGRPTGEATSDGQSPPDGPPASERDYSKYFSVTSHTHDFTSDETLVITYAPSAPHELGDVEVGVTVRRHNDVITGGSRPLTERWGSLRPGETRTVKTTKEAVDPVVKVSLAGTGKRDGGPIRFTAEVSVR